MLEKHSDVNATQCILSLREAQLIPLPAFVVPIDGKICQQPRNIARLDSNIYMEHSTFCEVYTLFLRLKMSSYKLTTGNIYQTFMFDLKAREDDENWTYVCSNTIISARGKDETSKHYGHRLKTQNFTSLQSYLYQCHEWELPRGRWRAKIHRCFGRNNPVHTVPSRGEMYDEIDDELCDVTVLRLDLCTCT